MSDRTLALAYTIEHDWPTVQGLTIDELTQYVGFISETMMFGIWSAMWQVLPDVALRPDFYLGDLIPDNPTTP